MEVIWKEPMITIGEIRERVSNIGWSDSTVKTLVRRLVKKGIIGIDDSKGNFRYFAIANESDTKLKETRNLIDKIYNGSVKLLMSSLVSDSNLTKDDAKRLMDIINKMED